MLRRSKLIVGILAVATNPAVSEIIDLDPAGLADPVRVITFDEPSFGDDTRVSAEFAELGVIFLPELYYRTGDHPDWDNINGPNLRSGNLAGNILHKTFSIRFDPPRSSAAFVAIAQPPTPTTFTAKFNGVEIESFDSDVVIGNPNNFFGFTDIIFDEIEIAYTAETRMRIDNVQLGPAVDTAGPPLNIAASGDELVLTWESEAGRLYTVRSETDPSAAEPKEWPIFESNMEIVATPPTNTLTIARPDDPFRLFVVEAFPAPPEVIFGDDFESGQGGWTTGIDDANGNTTWELGSPAAPGPASANSGANVFGTNLSAVYGENADAWLRSPAIDLSTAAEATLTYFEFRDIEPQFDSGAISVLDASDDSEIAVIEDGIDGTSTGWQEVSKRLPPAALGQVIKLEFRLQSDDFQTFAGWYLDDVQVTVP